MLKPRLAGPHAILIVMLLAWFTNATTSGQQVDILTNTGEGIFNVSLDGIAGKIVPDVPVLSSVDRETNKLYYRRNAEYFRSDLNGENEERLGDSLAPRRIAFNNADNQLFFLSTKAIHQASIDNPSPVQIAGRQNSFADIDYHNGSDSLFVVNQTALTSGDSLFRYSGSGYSNIDRILTGFSRIGGVAVDEPAESIFFTANDTAKGNGIFRAALDGSELTQVLELPFPFRAGDVEIAPELGLVVWHDVTSNQLFHSDYLGSDPTLIASLAPYGSEFDTATGQHGFWDVSLAVSTVPEPSSSFLLIALFCTAINCRNRSKAFAANR